MSETNEGASLLGIEKMALDAARKTTQRGESVDPITASALILALDRLVVGADDWPDTERTPE